jgi:hypothetical protein
MELVKPVCRNISEHPAHSFWSHGYTVWNECPGQTAQDADTAALAEQLTGLAVDHAWPMALPAGTRLECHPLVPLLLTRIVVPSYAEFSTSLHTGEVTPKTYIPVVVRDGMDRGAWELVSDDTGLMDQGVIRG